MLFGMKSHAFSDTHKICNAACKAASGAVSLKRARPSSDTAARAKTRASRAEMKVVAEAASGAEQTQSIAAFSPRVDIDDCLRSQEGSVFDPFRGRVPSPQDWRDAWADVISCVSIRKQCRLANMKQRGRISRQARKKMTLIMGEDARQKCRKRLAQATSVTVALDDCGGRKVLRFRCDTPGPPYRYDGLIGVLSRTYSMEELRTDHAEHCLKLVDKKVKSFWTPLAPNKRRKAAAAATAASGADVAAASGADGEQQTRVDACIAEFRKKVRIVAADGGSGERRTVF